LLEKASIQVSRQNIAWDWQLALIEIEARNKRIELAALTNL
jgi:hypothetical protein